MAVTPAYAKWYKNQKLAHNLKRREKYATDPVYRESVQAKIRSRRLQHQIDRPKKTVFTIKEAAAIIKTSTLKLRKLEADGYIPKILNEMGYRIYTELQCALVADFIKYADNLSTSHISRKTLLELKSNILRGQWDVS